MSWLNELERILVSGGVGTSGINIFVSTAAQIPTGAGPYLLLTETGGYDAERTHDTAAGLPDEEPEAPGHAYERPTAQILVRGATYRSVKTMTKNAYKALIAVRNEFILVSGEIPAPGVWYRSIRAMQPPFDMGSDSTHRARAAFNVVAEKKPS